jgi:RNA polymerase sigma-70 factor (ECF subfamily)
MTALYRAHADTVYRVCYTCMKGHRMDAEDALQMTFLALLRCGKRFEGSAHKKAWLIVTASNICRNMLKRRHRSDVPFDADAGAPQSNPQDETLQAVLALPEHERLSIYLHYYEGYSAREIGAMLRKKDGTVWSYLHRGRGRLKAMLKEDMK